MNSVVQLKNRLPFNGLSFGLVIFLLIGAGAGLNAQTNIFQNNDGDDLWSNPNNWSEMTVPTPLHDVVIQAGVGDLDLDTDATIASLTFESGAVAVADLYILSNYSLTVNGPVKLNHATAGGNDRRIHVGAGTFTCASIEMTNSGNDGRQCLLLVASGGTVNVSGNVDMLGSSVRNQINLSNTGVLNLGGSMTGGTLIPGTGSRVNYNGTTAQTFLTGYNYHDVWINNTAGVTLNGNITSTGVTGSISVQTGTLHNDGFAMALNAAETFSVSNGATFNLSGTSSMVSGAGTYSFGATSNVNYSGANQNVFAGTYGNLSLSGSGTKTLGGNTTVAGTLNIASGVMVSLPDGSSSTANALTMGGLGRPLGTHGSTASSATYKSDVFFDSAANGTLSVTNNTCASSSAVISGTTTICAGSSTDLSVAITGGVSPYTVVHSGGTVSNYVSGSNIPVSPASTTTYTLTSVTDNIGCAVTSLTGEAVVTVINGVSITSATAGASPICPAETTTLTANGVTGQGATVTWWTGSGGTGTQVGTGTTSDPVGPGTYYARVTGDCGTAEASVTVVAKINVGISGVSAALNPICADQTTDLTANGVVGTNATVTWWTGAGGTGTNLGTGTTLEDRTGPNTYYAQVTGDCASPAEASIAITEDGPVHNTDSGRKFCTIQAAVSHASTSSGHTINVAAGTYAETITIDKTLTLNGPNAANAGNGSRVAEAIVQFPTGATNGSPLMFVAANVHGVTIAGFDLRCQDATIPNYHYLIGAWSGAPVNNLTIRNNRMYSSEIPIYMLAGFGANGGTGVLIEGNYIDCGPNVNSSYNRGMYIGGTSGTIQDNVVLNANIGIQYMPYDNANPGFVRRNTVSSALSGLYHNYQVKGAGLVTWEQNVVNVAPNPRITGSLALQVDGAWTQSQLVGYRGMHVISFGIQGTGNNPEVLFRNNSIDATNTHASIPGNANPSTVFRGFWMTGSTAGTATLENNSFTNYTNGLVRAADATVPTINASCNWWGSANGASVAAATTSSNSSYIPWLTNGTDDSGDQGFQPVAGSCNGTPVVIASATPDDIICGEASGSINVSWSGGVANYTVDWGGTPATGVTGSPYNITGLATGSYTITVTDQFGTSGTFGPVSVQNLPVHNITADTRHATIQAAINAASNGHTIDVCAGTYVEQVTVSKQLTLRGPNANIPGNGSRMPEAIIEFPAGGANFSNLISIDAGIHNVTIEGFDMRIPDALQTGTDQYRYLLVSNTNRTSGCNNLTIRNNRLYSGIYIISVLTRDDQTDYRTGLLIEGNYIDGGPWVNSQFNRGMYIQATSGTIQDNVIVNTNIGIQYMPYKHTTPGLIRRNTVSSYLSPLYHNYQTLGAALVTYEENELSAAPNPQTGLLMQVYGPFPAGAPIAPFAAFYVRTFGTEQTGAAPTVLFQKNNVNATAPAITNMVDFRVLRVRDGAALATVNMQDNSFVGYTSGVLRDNAPSTVVNATCNWWGQQCGPSSGHFSGTVTYTPWITSGGDGPGIGFQPTGTCNGGTAVVASGTEVNITSCFGDSNGSIDLSPSGGVPPYTYLWSTAATTEDISGLAAGEYSVTVTDFCGQSANQGIGSFTITQPAQITGSGAVTSNYNGSQLSCIGATDGAITVTATGGTGTFTYSIDGGAYQISNVFTGLAAGSHTLSVKDANNCEVSLSNVTITEPTAVAASISNSANVICNGGSTGSATVTASGGTSGYTYLWSNGATSATASGLAAGSYNVTVYDANLCTATANVTITQPDPLTPSTTKVDVLCNGASSGSIDLSVSGGTSPYTYLWSNGSTTEDISSLAAGTYMVTINDNILGAADNNPYFESFSTTHLPAGAQPGTLAGTVDLQNGWTTRDAFLTSTTVGKWDQQVIQVNDGNGNRKVFRMSNAITSGIYASQVFSATSGQVAGETNAALWNNRGTNGSAPLNPAQFGAYAANNTFYTKVKFRSATGAAQPGLQVTLSPSAKQSTVRMSWLQLQDNGSTGFNVNFIEATGSTGLGNSSFSSTTTVASGLSYTDLHTVEMSITFVDGVNNVGGVIYGNDIVKIYVNGNLVHTGTTWESYYYNNERITAGNPRLQAVNALLFRVAGTAATATSGNGFYFEDFRIGNSVPALTLYGSAALSGCTTTTSATINQPAAPVTISGTQTNVICNGTATGTIDLTVSGGTAPYSYLWSNGETTEDIDELVADTYDVTVTDANGNTSGCIANTSVTITQPEVLNATVAKTDVTCNGAANGTITVSDPDGGYGTFEYRLNEGAWQSSGSFTDLAPNTYSVQIRDAEYPSCVVTLGDQTITQPTALLANIPAQTNILCFGGNNGSATVSASGGTLPYSYDWSGTPAGDGTVTVTGLTAGGYTVTVTDGNNCQTTASVTITQPEVLTVSVPSATLSCNNGATTTLTATPAGGTSPYTYAWSVGGSSATTTALGVGSYTVTVTDANNCVVVSSAASVSNPVHPGDGIWYVNDNSLAGDLLTTAAGNNSNIGTASCPYLTVSHAITQASAGHTINVDAGTYSENILVNKSLTINGVHAGVKATGSTRGSGESIINGTGGSSSYVVTIEADNVTLNGLKVELRLSARDGINTRTGSPVSPATIAYRSGITLKNNWVFANLPSRTNQFNGMVFGEHISNSAQTFSAEINNVTIEDNYIDLTSSSTNATPTSTSIVGARGIVFTNMFRNSGASLTYNNLVVDDNTVFSTYNTIIQAQLQTRLVGASFTNNIIGKSRSGPNLPTLINSVFSNNTILDINPNSDYYSNLAGAYLGVVNSTIERNVFHKIGGTACLVIAGGRSADPTYFPASNNSIVQNNFFTYNDQALSSLAGYTSAVLVEPNTVAAAVNVNGWLTGRQSGTTGADASTITVSNNSMINAGFNPSATTYAISQESVNETLTATCNWYGATSDPGSKMSGSVSYSPWLINGTDDQPSTFGFQPVAGSCSATSVVVTLASQTNILGCFGDATGAIDITVSGGTGPGSYTYDWSNDGPEDTDDDTEDLEDLVAGSYTVTVTDGYGSTGTLTVTITQPAAVSPVGAPDHVSCYGGSDGNITLSVTGGTAPFSYFWEGVGIKGGDTYIYDLAAGTYSVTVTDANNCTGITSVVITQPASALTAGISSQTNVSCNGGSNGVATVTADGGTPGYTYSWSTSPAQTGVTASGLAAGTYTVTVTDANGCMTTTSVMISQPATAVSASITAQTNVSCNGGSNGSATVLADGGTPGYTYSWSTSPAQTGVTATGLAAGTYTVTVTDANGCQTTAAATITQPATLTSSITAQTNNNCNGADKGSATVTPSGGTPGFTYLWSTSPAQTSATATELVAGTYTVTVTDSNGCTSSSSATITEPGVLVITGQPANVNATVTCGTSAAILAEFTAWNTGITYSGGSSPTVSTNYLVEADENGTLVTKYNGPVATAPSQDGGVTTVTWTVSDVCGNTASVSRTFNVLSCPRVSGKLNYYRNNAAVNGVNVKMLQGATLINSINTSGDGSYSVFSSSSGNFNVVPDEIRVCGTCTSGTAVSSTNLKNNYNISLEDVTAIQAHVGAGAQFSNIYQRAAANVVLGSAGSQTNNRLTSADATSLTQAINGNLTQQARLWRRAIPKDTTLTTGAPVFLPRSWGLVPPGVSGGLNPAEYGDYPTRISYSGLDGAYVNQDFVIVQVGDVVAHPGSSFRDGAEARYAGLPLIWKLKDVELVAGESIDADFRIEQMQDLRGWQFGLQFDPEYLKVDTISTSNVLSLDPEVNFGLYRADEGEIRSLWAEGTPHSVNKGESIFKLRFTVLKGGKSLSEVLTLEDDMSGSYALTDASDQVGIMLSYESLAKKVQSPVLHQNVPNPFNRETLIRFELPSDSPIQLSIHDITGRLVKVVEGNYSKGIHEVRFDTGDLGQYTGILYYTLSCGDFTATHKMVVIE